MSWTSVSEKLPAAWQRVLFVARLDSGPRICFGCWTSGGKKWMAESEYDQGWQSSENRHGHSLDALA